MPSPNESPATPAAETPAAAKADGSETGRQLPPLPPLPPLREFLTDVRRLLRVPMRSMRWWWVGFLPLLALWFQTTTDARFG